ncbi:unnamed protein product [Arctogadus glacialis]
MRRQHTQFEWRITLRIRTFHPTFERIFELRIKSDSPNKYEPEYSQEEFTQIEKEAAEAAAEQALPIAEDEEPERAGLLCSPIDTNTESLCCSEFQQCQFLLEQMAESGEDGAMSVTSHPGFTLHLNSWVLNWKRQPKPAGRNRRLSIEQYRLPVLSRPSELITQHNMGSTMATRRQ